MVLAYQFFFTPISIEIEIVTPKKNIFQIFYADQQHVYNEKQSRKFRVKPELTNYDFILPAFLSAKALTFKPLKTLNSIRKLRIDPMKKSGTIRIKRIVIKQNGYKPLRFETIDQLKRLRPAKDIASIDYQHNGMVILSSGRDPQLEAAVNPQIDFRFVFCILIAIILVDFILHLLSGGTQKEDEFKYAPYLMVFIFALIFAGGAICTQMHADEGHHLKAGIYYMDHWLPPKVCDPSIAHTYSVYGVSRLDSSEIVYLVAGKFAKLFAWLPLNDFLINDFLRFRFFNIGLFLILTLLSIKSVEYRILCLPLLVTPQIWYVFTYFNSEAFAVFIIILIGYQAVSEKSMLHHFMTMAGTKHEIIKYAIGLGLLFALLLLIKLNFLVFAVFLACVFLLKLILREYDDNRRALLRVLLILLVAASVWGTHYGIDASINGFGKKDKCFECRKKLALPLFNPATPLAQRHLYLRLKERGLPLKKMFNGYWRWGYLSFWRSFGSSYFFKRPAPDWYLKVVLIICILFSFYLSSSIVIGLQLKQILLLLIVFLCSLLLIALSIWNSWTASFQALGRYLFPIFIMTGFLIFQSLTALNKKYLNFFILLMFLLSLYSYLFVGLLQLPKL
ncbi:hypothetical protein QUF75_00230 [Desulfococcaceae bacterium HSG7]|nr:hypothetical protein [Desulfococcaceae bacterium HSG7]